MNLYWLLHEMSTISKKYAVVLILLCTLVVGLHYFVKAPDYIRADENYEVYVRIMGPADKDTFAVTGEYTTIWVGDVYVPRTVEITTLANNIWRFSIDTSGIDDQYIAECISGPQTGTEHDRGEGDASKGATSVLAATEAASQQGSFQYKVTDNNFPGMGMFVIGIGDNDAAGAVGWNYRVWNEDDVYTPSLSSDMFLLGYNTTPVSLPHKQVLWFWGGSTNCFPLRITLDKVNVSANEEITSLVEYYRSEGFTGFGNWLPLSGANVTMNGEPFITDENGEAVLSTGYPGSYSVIASKAYNGTTYFIPSDDRITVNVTQEDYISFNITDYGETGVIFGDLVASSLQNPEVEQNSIHGAVMLCVSAETNVDCEIQLKAIDSFSDGGTYTLPVENCLWNDSSNFTTAKPMTADYITIASTSAGIEKQLNLWYWITIPDGHPAAQYSNSFYYRVIKQ